MVIIPLMVPKSCSTWTWDVKNPAKNGTNHQPQLVIAGFLNHQQYHYQKFIYLQVETVSRPRPTTFSKKIACHEIFPQFRGCVDILFFWDSCVNWWSLLAISIPFPTKAQLSFGKAEFRVRFVKGFSGAYTKVPWRFCNFRPLRSSCVPHYSGISMDIDISCLVCYVTIPYNYYPDCPVIKLFQNSFESVITAMLPPHQSHTTPLIDHFTTKNSHESWVINLSWVIRIYYILCIICNIHIHYITYHIFSCIISSSYNPKIKERGTLCARVIFTKNTTFQKVH